MAQYVRFGDRGWGDVAAMAVYWSYGGYVAGICVAATVYLALGIRHLVVRQQLTLRNLMLTIAAAAGITALTIGGTPNRAEAVRMLVVLLVCVAELTVGVVILAVAAPRLRAQSRRAARVLVSIIGWGLVLHGTVIAAVVLDELIMAQV